MLPMFRQLKINKMIKLLELLEQKTKSLSKVEIKQTVKEITTKMPLIIKDIKEAIS